MMREKEDNQGEEQTNRIHCQSSRLCERIRSRNISFSSSFIEKITMKVIYNFNYVSLEIFSYMKPLIGKKSHENEKKRKLDIFHLKYFVVNMILFVIFYYSVAVCKISFFFFFFFFFSFLCKLCLDQTISKSL
jgi:hypothetical protein